MTALTSITKSPILNSEVWTVGAGGDYLTLASAIAAYLDQTTLRDTQITLMIQTGYVITVSDQTTFSNVFAPNLVIDTQSTINVDGSGFIANAFSQYSIFTCIGSVIGSVVGQFQLAVPTPGPNSAVVTSIFSTFNQSEFPSAPSIQSIGFRFALSVVFGKSLAYGLTTDGAIISQGGDTLFITQCSLSGFAESLPLVSASSGASITLAASSSISITSTNPTAVFSASGNSSIYSEGGSVSTVGKIANLSSGSLNLTSTLAIDQTTPNTVFSLLNSQLVLANAPSITNPTPGWTLFDLSGRSVVTGNNIAVTSTEWSTVSNVPIGQAFADGSGIFGVLVDSSPVGKAVIPGSEGGSIARPLYSSEVEITGGPFNNLTFTDDLFNLPVGAKIKYTSSESIGELFLTFNGSPWRVSPVMPYQTITVTRTTDELDVESSIDETSGTLSAGRSFFLPVLLDPGTTSHAVVLSNLNRTIVFNDPTACSLNLPDAATVYLPPGFQLNCRNNDPAGIITVIPAGGDSVTGAGTVTNFPSKVFSVYLEYENAGVRRWVTAGDMV